MQDKPKGGAEDEADKWLACITLELPKLGALEVEISLQANRVVIFGRRAKRLDDYSTNRMII